MAKSFSNMTDSELATARQSLSKSLAETKEEYRLAGKEAEKRQAAQLARVKVAKMSDAEKAELHQVLQPVAIDSEEAVGE